MIKFCRNSTEDITENFNEFGNELEDLFEIDEVPEAMHFSGDHLSTCDSELIDRNHICKQSIDADTELNKSKILIGKLKESCKSKSAEIKRLRNALNYHQKRVGSMKKLISSLKQQNLITKKAEQFLNVS